MNNIKRTKLSDRSLPDYTRGEEIFNMVTHIVGAAISVAILALCVIFSAIHNDPWAVVGSAIYGATLIVMFTVSSIYHGLCPCMGKKVMQVIDHCDIYFMIAGTYTPVLFAGIRPEHPAVCWIIFGVEWGLAIVAAVFNAIDLKKYEKFSMFCYLGMGWTIVIAIKPTLQALTWNGFLLMLAGGIAYTIGAMLYSKGKTKRYMHSVFHIFVVIAAVLQFLSIFFYVI